MSATVPAVSRARFDMAASKGRGEKARELTRRDYGARLLRCFEFVVEKQLAGAVLHPRPKRLNG